MSILSLSQSSCKNPVEWDDIGADEKEKIAIFYEKLWKDTVFSFCAENLPLIKKCHLMARMKSEHGLGYVALQWSQNDDLDDDISIVTSRYAPLDDIYEMAITGEGVDPYTRNVLLLICESVTRAATKGAGEIVVYSHHAALKPDRINDSCLIGYNDNGVIRSGYCRNFPLNGVVVSIDSSLCVEVEKRIEKRTRKKCDRPSERLREDELYDWLRIRGVSVERQVKTSSDHVIDLWIPDKMMVELKSSSVTGNDVCQCIEYASEYRLPIVLVGDKISGAASRGIKGFNRLCPKNKILFISWDAIHDYLEGKLKVRQG